MSRLPKSKVLFITPLPPPVHGSSMMCDYIRKSELIRNEFDCDFINLSTSRSIEEIGKGGLKKYVRLLSSLCKTFGKLLTKRYDLCYIAITCHGGGFLKDAPFALLCKMFGKKLVIHQHNKGMSKDVGKPIMRKLLNLVYRNSNVILLSERLYPDIQEIVDYNQVEVCPNGIPEIDSFSSIPIRHNNIPHLLFLSNLIPSKGVFTLLDALKILKDKGLSVICNFVGGESQEINREIFYNEVKKRGIQDIAFYLGRKYGNDKEKEFARHDVFVFPTYYDNECFPLVLLEAMQAGMPCISTNEGAIPDLLDGTGLVVPPQNPQKLADSIQRLISDKDLYNQLSQESFDRFKTHYTLDKFEKNRVECLAKAVVQ